MTVKAITCHVVFCDGCGEDITPDADGIRMHYDDPDEARNEVNSQESGGCSPDGDWCHTCKLRPHVFVPDEYCDDECQRCRIVREEHEDGTSTE